MVEQLLVLLLRFESFDLLSQFLRQVVNVAPDDDNAHAHQLLFFNFARVVLVKSLKQYVKHFFGDPAPTVASLKHSVNDFLCLAPLELLAVSFLRFLVEVVDVYREHWEPPDDAKYAFLEDLLSDWRPRLEADLLLFHSTLERIHDHFLIELLQQVLLVHLTDRLELNGIVRPVFDFLSLAYQDGWHLIDL